MTTFPRGAPFVFRFWWLWELIAFILVCYWIGFLWSFGLILLGSVIGFLLIRRQGSLIMRQMKQNQMQAMFTMIQSIENSFILLSGFLLMVPGFLTDIIGLMCLIPVLRRRLIRKFMNFNLQNFSKNAANQSAKPAQPNTIEGEFWREKDK